VSAICRTVSVLRRGRQVEGGRVDDVFHDPQHEYTRELIRAIPGTGRPAREDEGARA
jgi:peptide/nickel transport system ATP-binding protein